MDRAAFVALLIGSTERCPSREFTVWYVRAAVGWKDSMMETPKDNTIPNSIKVQSDRTKEITKY